MPSYDIVLERGVLGKAGAYLNLRRKVMIVSDSGVSVRGTTGIQTVKATDVQGGHLQSAGCPRQQPGQGHLYHQRQEGDQIE